MHIVRDELFPGRKLLDVLQRQWMRTRFVRFERQVRLLCEQWPRILDGGGMRRLRGTIRGKQLQRDVQRRSGLQRTWHVHPECGSIGVHVRMRDIIAAGILGVKHGSSVFVVRDELQRSEVHNVCVDRPDRDRKTVCGMFEDLCSRQVRRQRVVCLF